MQNVLQNLVNQIGIFPVWIIASLLTFLRYILLTGSVYLLFYVFLEKKFRNQKIQRNSPERIQLMNEMKNSFYTSMIFAFMGMSVFAARHFGYTKHYFNISEYGWLYFGFSIVFLVFAHDTYFYWIHRMMHSPKLFRLLHRVHHLSFNPTPMTSFSFHPLESFLEFGIVPLIVFIIPIHPYALLFLSVWSLIWNIYGHLGFELFPKGFATHRFWGWFNTSVHHNMHHQRVNYNFGLYFNIWDRLMKTNHPDYLKVYQNVKNNHKHKI